MYGLLGDPSFHPIYADTARTLETIARAGIQIAIVSDIHVDLRDHARRGRLDHFVDAWVLSFEHGVQKPDPVVFQLALDALGARAETTLMVGDRESHDGAAADLGIDTLILPRRPRTAAAPRLDAALRLLVY